MHTRVMAPVFCAKVPRTEHGKILFAKIILELGERIDVEMRSLLTRISLG